MGQADLCFLPLHALAFASITEAGAAAHGGHHGAVGLDDESLLVRHSVGQALRKTTADAVDRLGVAERDLADGALADHDAVVLNELVHRLGHWAGQPQNQSPLVAAGASSPWH